MTMLTRTLKQSLSTRWINTRILSANNFLVHVQQNFQPNATKQASPLRVANFRSFTSTPIILNDENGDDLPPLSELIQQEIEAEENLKTNEMPQELSELLEHDIAPNWRLVDNPDSSQIRLFRKEPTANNNSKVILSFHCQDTIPQEASLLDGFMTQEGQEETYDDDSNEEEEDSDPIRFTVTVTRAGKSLLISCISEDAAANIESILVKKGEDQDGLDFTAATNAQLYQGPQFTELEQDLQDGFHDFLKDDCGVDENIAAFVSMYADYKEQIMYMNWLNGTLSMVK